MRTPSWAALGAALALLVVCLLVPSAASAKQARLFAGTFGAASNPAPFPANPYPLGTAEAVAVDATSHDLYVADRGNARVEKFDPEGNFILMFGRNVNKTKVEEALSTQAQRNLCTLASGDVCQAGETVNPSDQRTPLEQPRFLAVDNSSGPSKSDVYVSNGGQGFGEIPGLIDKFDSSGNPISSWASAGQLDGAAVPAGPFAVVQGIAVDGSGNLWVSERHNRLSEFAQDSTFAQSFAVGTAGELAVDSEGSFFLNAGGTAFKFDSAGKLIGQVAPSKAEVEAAKPDPAFGVNGLAVDTSSDDLYLDGHEGGEKRLVKRYDSSCQPVVTPEIPQPGCAPVETFGEGLIPEFAQGIAIDPASHAIYIAAGERVALFAERTVPDVNTTKPANPTATTATLTGLINPGGVLLHEGLEGCRFEWGETTSYGHTEPCNKTAAEIGNGTEAVEVTAPITGLQAGHTYHYRLVASNPNDVNGSINVPSFGADLAFGPPLIASASAISVTSNSATLQAEVNPQNVDTRLRIEYVTQAQFEAAGFFEPLSTPETEIGSGGTVQTTTFDLEGLTPATAYRFRAVAENVLGEGPEAVIGPEATFTTQATGALALPDSRQWQLVSPANKLGARIEPISETGVIQAAVDGGAITYFTRTPTEAEPEGAAEEAQILSSRNSAGWSSRDIAIPHVGATGHAVGSGPEYKFFSADLSQSAVQLFGPFNPALSAEASEPTAYLHDLSPSCGVSCFRPLVTAKEGFANVPLGTEFGEAESCTPREGIHAQLACGPKFLGASDDLSHVVLSSNLGLELSPGEPGGLYEWSAGELVRVSVLPSGEPDSNGSLGSSSNARGALSSDGSRVVWTDPAVGSSLFLRDTEPGHEQTLQLDAAEPACIAAHKCQSGGGAFQIASGDGSRVFFTDTRRLTADSAASPTAPIKADLYECAIVEDGEGDLTCDLTDLTPANGAEGADVQGGVLGASTDGSFIYYVAKGVQSEAPNERGQTAVPGQFSLYVRHNASTRFIATLAGGDEYDWREALVHQPTRVSVNGRFLELMSEAPLTGYDNRDASTGKPVAEVYVYDVAANRLRCASCQSTGARPHGVEYGKLCPGGNGLAGCTPSWGASALVAASVPGWTQFSLGRPRHQPRYLSDSGRLFFNSADALVPQDSNGTEDVYQYEPPGVGGCAASSPTFGPASGGCVDLISAGTSGQESAFLDASESGDDVFFLTASQLVPTDEDAALDVYDAHSCPAGAAVPCLPSPPPPAPACEGDACQQPAVPPSDQTPGSLTFSGAGNLTECPTGKVKKSDKCVAAKKHKAKKKSKSHKKRKKAHARKRGSQ